MKILYPILCYIPVIAGLIKCPFFSRTIRSGGCDLYGGDLNSGRASLLQYVDMHISDLGRAVVNLDRCRTLCVVLICIFIVCSLI